MDVLLDNSDLTERINMICYKLEHYIFIPKDLRQKYIIELDELIKQRKKIMETENEGK